MLHSRARRVLFCANTRVPGKSIALRLPVGVSVAWQAKAANLLLLLLEEEERSSSSWRPPVG